MKINNTKNINRRSFVKRASSLMGMGAAMPMALNLGAMGEAAALENSDYKALVCVFLYGGNDHANTIIPYDNANYELYRKIRASSASESIAIKKEELVNTAINPLIPQTFTDNMTFALNPKLKGLKQVFDKGHLAIQLNVGSLMAPTNLKEYNSPDRDKFPLPPKLFSHNDQQSIWQSLGSEGSTIGWGGRLGDLALSSNKNSLLTCISAGGNAVFVSGNESIQYQIGKDGATPIWGAKQNWLYGSNNYSDALHKIITKKSDNLVENSFVDVTKRSISLEEIVNNAIKPIELKTSFDSGKLNELADQLKIIARMIGARNTLGLKRQVFFVALSGFDNHDKLMLDHPVLMEKLNDAMKSFYDATVELGVENNVTTFTASDFGRTLSSNGNGSDHGWGSHQFIMGGAVKGGRFYGIAPHISIKTDDQVGQGRLLPSTSIYEFASTLATWFGVSASEMPNILPNITRFSNKNIGFMA